MTTYYLLDTNIIASKNILSKIPEKHNFCVIDQTLEELKAAEDILEEIRRLQIKELSIKKEHLIELSEVMKKNGRNLDLIQLFNNTGTADVIMLAYVIVEGKIVTLFPDKYILVTEDSALRSVAKEYGIESLDREGLVRLFEKTDR